ncbi:hypothetical protein OU994_18130 [Pseudoduganella sp. SL102]|uniref:hypothetical protein n=1 Tax=Pseudoduganella sp. SL102 TaxID=2995154 RepID=UPI00248B012C|nr:hypothetical protein [Pseudoduganella sp. SL102]WBS00240.1 hypothetical protein OU994_18130 [Pseudoduganella sp. SL102]
MNQSTTTPVTPDETIARQARVWRSVDQVAIADKRDSEKQRAEYRARQQLRAVIDQAKEGT